jgi:adenylyl-sulfate kinase
MSNSNNPCVLWFFGLSGSGKSTLSTLLFERLKSQGYAVFCIDGDQLRNGLNQDLGFSSQDRMENIRRAAELAKLLSSNYNIVLASFITPEEVHRNKVRELLGDAVKFIFVDADLETCRSRDPKGLYQRAHSEAISDFTGISAPFERPNHADLVLDTAKNNDDDCLEQLLETFSLGK